MEYMRLGTAWGSFTKFNPGLVLFWGEVQCVPDEGWWGGGVTAWEAVHAFVQTWSLKATLKTKLPGVVVLFNKNTPREQAELLPLLATP